MITVTKLQTQLLAAENSLKKFRICYESLELENKQLKDQLQEFFIHQGKNEEINSEIKNQNESLIFCVMKMMTIFQEQNFSLVGNIIKKIVSKFFLIFLGNF